MRQGTHNCRSGHPQSRNVGARIAYVKKPALPAVGPIMTSEEFIAVALSNPANRAIIDEITGLPEAWLAGGCLVQTVWNSITNRPLTYGINDYDVIYFDADTSWEAEDAIIRRLEQRLLALQIRIEIRNQARVHLWYPQRHGRPYPPLISAAASIDRFLTTNTQVGLRRTAQGCQLYAPRGLHDAVGLVVRPNATANFSASNYEAKASRWKAMWPEITVEPADAA